MSSNSVEWPERPVEATAQEIIEKSMILWWKTERFQFSGQTLGECDIPNVTIRPVRRHIIELTKIGVPERLNGPVSEREKHKNSITVFPQDIVFMLKYQDQGNPEEREEVNVSTNLISHEDAACTLELALRNVKQQDALTLTEEVKKV
ncbi:hypothetical protein AVEN_231404-1 [Araneus ventricosus]|uniref:Uncharacterized protein n=1 Tax=Araneus ventricosus TaxID=182803 RepID=A0A4Y2PU53_ARAVE|nr:hypothetical protein AVEN_231404-1 [Araneus ventricosus]